MGPLAAVALLAGTSAAQAGTITVTAPAPAPSQYNAQASATTADVLTVTLAGNAYTLTAGAGTTLASVTAECGGTPTTLNCTPSIPRPLFVDLADGSDTYSQGPAAGIFGGVANLGAGNDTFSSPAVAPTGLPVLGGIGSDHVDLSGRSAGVTATIGPGSGGIPAEAVALTDFEQITGGSGGDTFTTRNTSVETVTCLGGTDSVIADSTDTVAGDCEQVDRGVTPAPPPDNDGDGVPDASDACPSQAGPAANGGCPLPSGDDAACVAARDKLAAAKKKLKKLKQADAPPAKIKKAKKKVKKAKAAVADACSA